MGTVQNRGSNPRPLGESKGTEPRIERVSCDAVSGETEAYASGSMCGIDCSQLGLCTILPLPISCGVWHIKWRSAGGHIAQKSRNSIAVVWVMQMGGGHQGMIDSCTHTNKGTNILYRPTHKTPPPYPPPPPPPPPPPTKQPLPKKKKKKIIY